MSSEIAIKVENLSKCYQVYDQPRDRLKQFLLPRMQHLIGLSPKQYFSEFWALKDVSFEVKKGEAVGIVGRNGGGKSTLLGCITGTLSPTSGVINIEGRIAALLELGSGFSGDFTGRENIYLNGALLGFSRDQINEKFDSIASFADIGLHLDHPVKTYSSGMMLRLAFAVQVQLQPDVLIIDEALAVGDSLFQKRCFQRIERLLSDGTTLLFVSHDQESVRTLTSRAVLLTKGRVTASGTSSEVLLEYRKQLHEDESSYFSDIAKRLSNKPAQLLEFDSNLASCIPQSDDELSYQTQALRFGRLSFGEEEAKILKVEILSINEEASSVFYPEDLIRIRITCQSAISTNKLNVGLRIRNKEGVKVYSWGTLNQDMAVFAKKGSEKIFWSRNISAGEIFVVDLSMQASLGVNLYEVQACISYEETPDYMNQRILHWVDDAAFFQILMRRERYFFGGIVDLKMSATW